MKEFIALNNRWVLPLLFFIIITPLTPILDLGISSVFYDQQSQMFTNNSFYQFIYEFAQLPGFAVFGAALLIFGLSYLKKPLMRHRDKCLMLILAMIIGPGLIINVILKPGWGRPRPRQVEELGGVVPFRSFYSPNLGPHTSDKYKSMPSGHASMGFYFFAVAVLGRRLKNRRLEIAGYCLAIGLGTLLGLTRIAQGGHFFSDVLISALITWWVALTLDWILFCERPYRKTV